jgi:hypothetical protein
VLMKVRLLSCFAFCVLCWWKYVFCRVSHSVTAAFKFRSFFSLQPQLFYFCIGSV